MAENNHFPLWVRVRSLGNFRPGYVRVDVTPPPVSPGAVQIYDVWLDEVPADLVPVDLRITNAEFLVLIEKGFEPIEVARVSDR